MRGITLGGPGRPWNSSHAGKSAKSNEGVTGVVEGGAAVTRERCRSRVSVTFSCHSRSRLELGRAVGMTRVSCGPNRAAGPAVTFSPVGHPGLLHGVPSRRIGKRFLPN